MARNGDDNSIPSTEAIADETAYRRYVDGEERAANLLVEKYSDALTFYINGYIRDMHEAEDLLMSTGCIVPLYYYTDIYMLDSNVHGFFSNPLGYKYFMYCTIG